MPEEKELNRKLTDLGFSMSVSEPCAVLDDKWGGPTGPPVIRFSVVVSFKGREVYNGPFSLGCGHLDLQKRISTPSSLQSMHEAWRGNRSANFKDKEAWRELCELIAKKTKLKPSMPNVVSSLVLDGGVFIDGNTFEDFCADFGYDTDSRSAEKTFRLCDDIGRALVNACGRDTVEETRELLQDY